MSVIITTDDLATYMNGVELDTGRAQQVVDAVNDEIETSTGRSWGVAQSGEETHDLASVIFLRHPDVITVSQVQRGRGSGDSTTLDADSYFVNAFGRLVLSEGRQGFFTNRDYVHVTYTYGVLVVPADLKLAALSMAADFYSYADEGNKEVSSEQVGSYRLSYASGSNSATGARLNSIINRLKVRRV